MMNCILSSISAKVVTNRGAIFNNQEGMHGHCGRITILQAYLYATEFLLETDHRPLEYLNKAKLNKHRLMRWALALQSFKFKRKSISGVDNVGADYMNRSDYIYIYIYIYILLLAIDFLITIGYS